MIRLQTKKLSIHRAGKTISQSLDLTMRASEVWGILGPNGCGKTTLLHTLGGLHTQTTGDIFLQDQLLRELKSKKIAQSIGILFQDFPNIFPQTVWEYCLMSRFPHLTFMRQESETDKKIVFAALKKMQMSHLRDRPIQKLSGGEKRRLAIAGILAQTPQIFLLDEPNNHLDLHHQMMVMNYFHELAKINTATIIMSLHDVNLAQQFCDFVLMMFGDGQVIVGSTTEVLTAENLTRLYQHPMKAIMDGKKKYWYG